MDGRRPGAGDQVTNPRSRHPSSRCHRGRLAFAAVAFVCSLSAQACGGEAKRGSDTPPVGVTLTVGFPQGMSRDPSFGFPQLPLLFTVEGLTIMARDGRPQPRLAETWTQSADGLRWTFRLRRGVVFHDGTPLTADLVKASLDASLARARGRSPGLLDVVSVQANSPFELVVSLSRRSSLLLDDINEPITKDSPGGPIGTGPFRIARKGADEIVLQAHNHYRGKPSIDRIVLKPYPTLRAAWASMMRGELDLLYEIGQDAVDFVRAETSVRVFSVLRPYVFLLAFNSQKPILTERRVRRALNLGVDRDAVITQALRGRASAVSGPIWPEHWAYDRTLKEYRYDPDQAKKVLAEARRSGALGNGERLSFICLIPENYTTWERIALILQRQLYDIGVDMRLELVPADKLVERLGKGDFDAVLFEVAAGPRISRPYVFWHSPGELVGWNLFGYSSPAADQTLDAMRTAPDERTFVDAVARFQRVMMDDPPAIFLCLPEVSRALSRRFQVPETGDSDVLIRLRDLRADVPASANH